MSGTRPQLFHGTGKKSRNLTLVGLRLNRGLSPKELAELAGVSAETIRIAERGHIPSPRVMFALADFFDVEVLHIWPLKGSERKSVIA
jgi:transcriptional regulator with XRE-family HTH domain